MRRGRPSLCGSCGTCNRCKRAAYMRNWWAQLPPERKREYLDKRAPDTRKGRRGTDLSAPAKRAHWTVQNAIRDGRLERQPCEVCGEAKTDAHHEDYARPLDVRWLCRKHHGEQHRIYHAKAA